MSIEIKPYLVRVDHVDGCAHNKSCGPECKRIYDGLVAEYALHNPTTEKTHRVREKIPSEWALTEAHRKDYTRKREVALLEQFLEEGRRRVRMKVTELAKDWLAHRTAEGYFDIDKDRQRLEDHVLPVLGKLVVSEVRPRHTMDLIHKLKITPSTHGGTLAPRTIRSIYFTCRQMFEWAVLQELILVNPIKVGPKVLPPRADKDPAWRKGAVFNRTEAELLVSSPLIPDHRRVYYALSFLTGTRPGQTSAFQWGDYEPEFEPLGRLSSSRAWSSKRKVMKSTKTGVDHLIPVHPALAKVLATWRLSGWQARHGRKPSQADLIVPNVNLEPRDSRKVYEDFLEDLTRHGLRHRRVYDARRTYMSLAVSCGASKDLMKWITHPKPTDVFDMYITPEWPSLCEQVMKLKFEVRGDTGNVLPFSPAVQK